MLNRYGMNGGGDQSSRLSSSRGHGGLEAAKHLQFMDSAAHSLNGDNNEDLLSGIPTTGLRAGAGENSKVVGGNNILSFLSGGTADEMSLALQMDQHANNQQNLNVSAD